MKYHYIEIILNFISSISWPIVSLIILSYFKKPILRFLKQVKRVSYGETVVERQNKSQKDEKSAIDILTKGNDFTYIDETLNKFSETTKKASLKVIEDETKVSEVQDYQQKYERILKYSQLLIIVKGAEKIYSSIYGSQIRLLQKLNYSREKTEEIKYLYDNAVKYFPETYKNYSYDNYLNYLVVQGLIVFEDDKDYISITETGKDFLRYLVESNSNLDKLF
ncbi:MAG: hypothetical protein EKK56_02485 [Flavobacteriaceae bacterium]|nr:MAG: hypothetical protein EKK56_02485 [Flavobacteriaceae bacterium]